MIVGDKNTLLRFEGNRSNSQIFFDFFAIGNVTDETVPKGRAIEFQLGQGIEVKPSAVLAEETRPFVCLLAVNTENDGVVTAKAMGMARRAAIVAAPWKPGACTVATVNAASAEVSGTPSRIAWDDTDVIAKEQEEGLLFRDMQNDAVQQLLRRLQATKMVTAL